MSRAGALISAAQELRAAARGAAAWSAAERRAVLSALEQVTALMVGTRSELLGAEEASGSWLGPGVPSLGALVGRDTGIGRGAGNARVRQGESWAEVSVLAKAAEAGEITTRHVDAVGRVTRAAGPAVREAMTAPEAQGRLLALARRMDAPAFAREVARTAASLDPTGPDRELERQRERRFLTVIDTAKGTEIAGLLDHQAGRRLRLSLEAITPRPAVEDVRTAGQRRADALVDLAEAVLASPDTGSGAAVRPHVSLLMSVETLAELRAAQGQRVAPGVGVIPGHRGPTPLAFRWAVDPVTDEEGNVIPLSEVARILCDCAVTRIVLDAAGEPVDLGRQARLYSGAQRRRCSRGTGGAHGRGARPRPGGARSTTSSGGTGTTVGRPWRTAWHCADITITRSIASTCISNATPRIRRRRSDGRARTGRRSRRAVDRRGSIPAGRRSGT